MSLFAEPVPVLVTLSSATPSLRVCPWRGQRCPGMLHSLPRVPPPLQVTGKLVGKTLLPASLIHSGSWELRAFKHSTRMYVNVYTCAKRI